VRSFARLGKPDFSEVEPEDLRRTMPGSDSVSPPPGRYRELELPRPGGAIEARLYLPPKDTPRSGLLLYLHGGGFVAGDLDSGHGVCERIARDARCHVLAIDYRLAPEAPFPAAVEDALVALRWALARGHTGGWDPQRLAVAGESAGGNLAAVAAREWTHMDDVPPLCAQVLICPLTDFRRSGWPSRREHEDSVVLSSRALRWFEEHYLPHDDDRDDPRASPLAASDLGGLPPAHVVTAELDPLRDEGEAYARAMRQAGVEVTLRRFASIHALVGLFSVLPEGETALRECTAFLRDAMQRDRTAGSGTPAREEPRAQREQR
jgi:acetyl esterase